MKLHSLRKIQLVFILSLFILNVIQALTLPLIDDEAYYWVWSNNLDFGYYDHPPMVALFIKPGYLLIPNTLGVRLVSALSSAVLYLIWLQILSPHTKKENYLFLGLLGSAGIFQGLGFVSTPDTPLLLFGSLFIWSWKIFTEKQNLKTSLFLGISMALTMYSKYHGAILISLAILPFIGTIYRSKWFYISLFFSLILYFPHLYWQYSNDWPSIQYHLYGRNQKEVTGFPFGEWLIGLFIIANPLLLYFYGKSIFRTKISKKSWIKSLIWISIGGILFFGLFAITRKIQPQWNLIIYMAVIPLTYLFHKSRKTLWIIRLSFLYIGLIFIVRIFLFFPYFISYTPMYQLKQFVLSAQEVNDGTTVFERYQKAAAYNFYTEQPSACLQVYTHRYSQYDLWNSENSIQGKTITFFGLETVSSDYIVNENGKNEFYKTIENFHSFPKLNCIVTPTSFSTEESSEQMMEIRWNNPYAEKVLLEKDSNLETGILFVNYNSLEPVVYIPFPDSIEIPGKEFIDEQISVSIPELPTGKYKSYIIVKPFGISGKIISNEMITSVQ